ncbi:serine hydrolase [Aureliella helgolandensis]|uniref:N-acyl-D-glutamate deacylase n=1 Tax=Aureliella helgolandensis TaxID=2527968 RepID=A0A518GDW8_9BACT|nr:serine hydrolase [Aureliella helgolandensis]QDV26792.1 N-acyl-D-glutamate deacylase [Aureliella helgolandensis]
MQLYSSVCGRSLAWVAILTLGLWGSGESIARSAEKTLDIVIQGGKVVDGTGAPWYIADIGISGGKIVRIGHIPAEDAKEVIDARGLVVAPGFVDMMGQTATPMLEDPKTALNLLTQGITTINAGEGSSAAPLGKEEEARQGYTTMAEYFALVELKGLPVNVVQTIGHTQVRRLVIGEVDRRPSDAEMKEMQELVREAMEAGAIGVSTALIYPPAIYAQTKEIAMLAATAGEYGGRYFTHMRNEGDRLLEAIDEALDIGREGNTPVHIFHLKAAGQQNWGKMQLAIAKIKAARAAGQQVTADIYPYMNNGLGIAALIHPRHFSKGHEQLVRRLDDVQLRAEIRQEMETTEGWENWFRHANHDWNRIVIGSSNDARYTKHDGKTVQEIATAMEEEPWDTFFNLVRSGAFALPQTMSDANKILAMQQNFVSFCTDVGPAGGSRSASHPRAFGAFPRLLSRYVRDLGAISLEQAVAQASAAATNNVLAFDRGRISQGLAADVIVFNYEDLVDHADFSNPSALSEGMKHVIVGGVPVLRDGEMTDARPGRVLRGPGYQASKAAAEVASGEPDQRFASYDRLVHAFMQEHQVPGVSIAVTNHGKLAFARGYGYADVATGEQVDSSSLFRIASLSKPITAVAILQLIERGQIELDSKVFEVLDKQDAIQSVKDSDPRLREITLRHLLEHRGGWDRNESFDAMFQSVRFAEQLGVTPPANQATVIQAMFSQPLDFDPGERYAYSNFGYCLLGRVIEHLSGQSYEEYVKEHVLLPLGITQMRIGATRLQGRAEHEVRYYQPGTGRSVFSADLRDEVPKPYGAWNLEAMDSHGGWIASASDLVKFAAAFDDPDHCPLLSRESIERMYARPPGLAGYEAEGEEKKTYYSLGWNNRPVGDGQVNHWHTGSLDGTATILIRRHDGKNFAALLNARVSPTSAHLGSAIDQLLHRAANEVSDWP